MLLIIINGERDKSSDRLR